MQIFTFNLPTNFVEKGKWLVAVISFEETNSVCIITDENNGFSISTLELWSSRGVAETIHKLQKLLELDPQNSQNVIELHVEEGRKSRNQIKIGDKKNKLSDLHSFNNEILDEFRM